MLGSADKGGFGLLDADGLASGDEVLEDDLLLLQVGSRNHGHVTHDEQLVVARVLDDGHVRQGGVGRTKTALLVEDGTHILVGRQQSLHQNVALSVVDEVASGGRSLHVNGLVDDLELLDVNVEVGADLLDGGGVTHQSGIDNSHLHGGVHRLDGVGVVGVGSDQTFFGLGLD